jgi:hypothetical protein
VHGNDTKALTTTITTIMIMMMMMMMMMMMIRMMMMTMMMMMIFLPFVSVQVKGSPVLVLDVGTYREATYVHGNGTKALTFVYTVGPNDLVLHTRAVHQCKEQKSPHLPTRGRAQ